MWDWYFFVMRMRISIFSKHKVWCCVMYSITCYILLDLLYWRMMKNVLIFHVIVIPHRRFHRIEWWGTWWDWCNFGVRLRFFVFSIPTRYDVFYNILWSSSGRAILSDDEKCYAISIHNHSSSTFSSSLVGNQHMGLVHFLHDVLNDNIYFWMCT